MVAERDSLDGLPSAQDKHAFPEDQDTYPPQQEAPYGSQAAAEAGRLLGHQREKRPDDDGESRAQSSDGAEYSEQKAQGRMTQDPERQQKQRRTIPASLADQKRRKKFLKEIISQILPMIVLSLVGSTLAGEIVEKLKVSNARSTLYVCLFRLRASFLICVCCLQFWEVFHIVPELFILVPIMLNLKGQFQPWQSSPRSVLWLI